MDLEKIINEIKVNKKGLYDLVANNYYNMSKEDLKEIALNAIYLLDDDNAIIKEIEERL